jgi:hypothetical protein
MPGVIVEETRENYTAAISSGFPPDRYASLPCPLFCLEISDADAVVERVGR